MKILILNIGCIIFCLSSFGQDSTAELNRLQKIDFTKYSLTERVNFYPFNIVTKVVIVSFDKQVIKSNSSEGRYAKAAYEGNKGDIKYGLPFLNDTICLSKLTQAKILSNKQIDSLTDILYNTCYRWSIREENKAMCYRPHNAILFFDKNDKVFDYIEICFDCHNFRFSNKKIEKFEQCDFLVADLKKYFKQMGLNVTYKDFPTSAGL